MLLLSVLEEMEKYNITTRLYGDDVDETGWSPYDDQIVRLSNEKHQQIPIKHF